MERIEYKMLATNDPEYRRSCSHRATTCLRGPLILTSSWTGSTNGWVPRHTRDRYLGYVSGTRESRFVSPYQSRRKANSGVAQ